MLRTALGKPDCSCIKSRQLIGLNDALMSIIPWIAWADEHLHLLKMVLMQQLGDRKGGFCRFSTGLDLGMLLACCLCCVSHGPVDCSGICCSCLGLNKRLLHEAVILSEGCKAECGIPQLLQCRAMLCLKLHKRSLSLQGKLRN